MKKYANLFYTRAFKGIIIVIITLLTWSTSGYITELFTLQISNQAAVKNVFTQAFGFSYETSEYVEQEIETAVDYILDYSLGHLKNFNPEEHSSFEDYSYYMSVSNPKYKKTVDYLSGLRGVNYAVVNHSTGIIISSLEEINTAPTGTEIRQLFASDKHPFIIIRNCSNPYYEQSSLPGYVNHVRKKASEFSDNCDLYISFTEGLLFRESTEYFENLHREYTDKVLSLANKILLFSFITISLMIILIKVCGRAEKGGRVIPAISDQLPNDLIIFFLLTIIASAITLYHTSLYMIYKTSVLDGYGLGFRPETYAFRADLTLVTIVYVLCILLCKIKRQRLLGTLWSGSYLCILSELLKKRKEEKKE